LTQEDWVVYGSFHREPKVLSVNLTAARPRILVSADGQGLVSQAGAALLVQAMRVTGLNHGLREELGQWRAPRAVHDPGKIVADLAVAIQGGATCGESLASDP